MHFSMKSCVDIYLGQGHPKAQARLQELKKGGVAGTQKSRERLSRSNVKHGEQGDCVIM